MTGQNGARAPTDDKPTASSRATARSGAPWLLPLALLGLCALALVIAAAPASAGSDDLCPLGEYEVDDSYLVANPVACQYPTLQAVLALPLTPSDVIFIHNGLYNISTTLPTNGLSFIGETQSGVNLNGNGSTYVFSVGVWDTNITNVSFSNASYPLYIQGGVTNRTTLVNITVTNYNSWGVIIYGDNNKVRNLTVIGKAIGVVTGGNFQDWDGVTVISTATSAYRFWTLFAANSRYTNLTLSGVLVDNGIFMRFDSVNNTFTNIFIENATAGINITSTSTFSVRQVLMFNVTTGILLSANTALNAVNVSAFNGTSGVAVDPAATSATLTMNGGVLGNFSSGIWWPTGGLLNVSNVLLRDIPSYGIYHNVPQGLNLTNLSSDNLTGTMVYCDSGCLYVNWTRGSINNTNLVIGSGWSTSYLNLSRLDVNNSRYVINNYAWVGGSVSLENSTFNNTYWVLYLGQYGNVRFNNNRISNSPYVGASFNACSYCQVIGNNFTNVTYPLYAALDSIDSPNNYYDMPRNNVIDGRPVYFYINTSNITVPVDAAEVFIVNSTSILVSGINQTNAAIGVAATLTRDLTVRDSRVTGYNYFISIQSSVNVSVTNLTTFGVPTDSMVYFYNVTDAVVRGFAHINPYLTSNGFSLGLVTNLSISNVIVAYFGSGVYIYSGENVSVRNVTVVNAGWTGVEVDSTTNASIRDVAIVATGIGLYLSNDPAVKVSNVIVVNQTNYGLLLDSSPLATVFNFTAVSNDGNGAQITNGDNVTVRNSTFASGNYNGLYAFNTPDLNLRNSTFVSVNATSFLVDSGCYNLVVIHNNFYGGAISNPYSVGTWDGGYPVAGNYYDYAVAGFIDEYTGPAQNSQVGKDGIKDAPAYPVGGGKNDNYALMDPWPPAVTLTRPANGSLIKAGTPLNFSISNFFDSVTWQDDRGGNATALTYPHDINTTGWADGWHNITIVASDATILSAFFKVPTVRKTFSFEFDSTAPIFSATPTLGTAAIARGTPINVSVLELHLDRSWFILDGNQTNSTPPWSIGTGSLAVGNHTLVLFANDTLNNSATYIWNFYIDGLAPTLSLLAPVGDDYFQQGTDITYASADEHLLSSVTFNLSEVGGGWSYAGPLAANGSNWSIDTAAYRDGCYNLQVRSTDAAGHVTSDARAICLDSTPPDLSAFTQFSTDEDVPYTFAGNLVVDLDTDPAYAWTFDDTVLLSVTVLTGATPAYTFATPGNYNVNLQVTDRAGNTAAVDFTLHVLDVTPPVADFYLPADWPQNVSLALDASNSTDNDGYWNGGATGNFTWDIVGMGENLTLFEKVNNVTLTVPGNYNVTLTVLDATGNPASLTQRVRVRDTQAPTVVIAGSLATRNEGDTVALNGSGSSDNDPASALTFRWTFTYGSSLHTQTGPLFSFKFDNPGTYAITLSVADISGNEGSRTVNIRINDVPAITNSPGLSVEATQTYEWDIIVADSDTGDVITYALTDPPNGMTVSSSGALTWATVAGSYGVHNVNLRVSDGIASVNYSYILTVTRAPNPANNPPFFKTFPVQNGTAGGTYSYAVEFADPDGGDQLTMALFEGPAGMTLDLGNALHWQIPANASDGSVYSVKLLLSDGLAQVWQNFTIRVRALNGEPRFNNGAIPDSVTVQEGQEIAILLSNVATDPDDSDLSFFVVPSDGSLVSARIGTTDSGQPALFIKGLKPGTSTVTLRVADPSGAFKAKDITTTVAATPAGSSPLLLLLALAGLVGAGVVGLLVVRRRKKEEEAPIAGAPAPTAAASAPAATEEVQVVEVVQPIAAQAPPAVSLPPAAPAAAVVAAAAAAAAAPAVPVTPARISKAASYVIEGLFVIYSDGRMIFSKTDIGQQQLGDPELVSSMFTAVQQFIKDSFSAEGELNKMGYGDNQILIERGNNVFMAVITFGEPDKELQEKMQTAIEKIEYAYAGVIEKWDGQQNRFADLAQYAAPVLALTSGITRTDVLAATVTKDVKVLSQLEFFQGFVRLKVGVKNDTEAVVTKVTLDIDYNEDVLRLQRIEPASYKTSGARVMLNVLNPGEKSSVAFYFDPQICTETNIDGIVRFRDYKGVLQSVTMKTRKAEVVCPLFFTKEHANTAMLKRLIENELQEKDSKIYTITKLPPYVKHKDIFDVCKAVVLSHDVHMVREFVSFNPFAGEAWFYGETKVKGYKIVIRAAVREDNTIEFFAASSVIKAVTGLLAEFNHTLVSMIVERYSDVKIEQVYDEGVKHQIQAKALVDKLGEGEAGAGETEQH